jgi:uncharacterized Zn finger protein
MPDTVLDGNAAGGVLSEVFQSDITGAVTTCATCGAVHSVGELRAYLQAPGTVLRCSTCGAVQLRLVRGPDRAWLDVRGVRVLEVQLPKPER